MIWVKCHWFVVRSKWLLIKMRFGSSNAIVSIMSLLYFTIELIVTVSINKIALEIIQRSLHGLDAWEISSKHRTWRGRTDVPEGKYVHSLWNEMCSTAISIATSRKTPFHTSWWFQTTSKWFTKHVITQKNTNCWNTHFHFLGVSNCQSMSIKQHLNWSLFWKRLPSSNLNGVNHQLSNKWSQDTIVSCNSKHHHQTIFFSFQH